MVKPDKFQLKQVALQKQSESNVRNIYYENINKLSNIIANASQKNTNYNKALSKKFTISKRELRENLKESINNSTLKARTFADDKNTDFENGVKENL